MPAQAAHCPNPIPYLGTQVAVPEKAEAAPLALPSSEVPDAPQTGGNSNPFAGLFSGAPRAIDSALGCPSLAIRQGLARTMRPTCCVPHSADAVGAPCTDTCAPAGASDAAKDAGDAAADAAGTAGAQAPSDLVSSAPTRVLRAATITFIGAQQ